MTQKRSQHVDFSFGADVGQQLVEVMSSQPQPMRHMGR